MADEPERSVVLSLLQVAFLEKCNDQGLVHRVGHSDVYKNLLQIVVRAMITPFSPAWASFAVMLSTPSDSPFLNNCITASISRRRMGWSSPMFVFGQFSADESP